MSQRDSDGEDRSVLGRAARPPDVTWPYGPLPENVADGYLPADRTGVPVLLVHGGFWRPEYDRVHIRPLAEALADAGHPVVSLEYRRIPGQPDAMLADLGTALDAVASRPPDGWPAEPAVVIGHSAGGHLALLLAASGHRALRSAVVLAPVADLALAEHWSLDGDAVASLLGVASAERADLDPVHCAPRVPVVILHGKQDSLVPVALSESYCRAHQQAVLRTIAETGHFELIDPLTDAFVELLSTLAATGIE